MTAGLHLAMFTVATCTCAGRRPDAGDPGGRLLEQLSRDRVFASLPAGALAAGPLHLLPARYRAPAFQGAGWDGPAVSLRFTSSQPPASVFAFFQQSAAAAGWAAANRNALGYVQTWTKTYPGGVRGTLSLMQTERAPAGRPVMFVLTASSPPAVSS